ncbi:MAG: 3-isopropylmalate dehydratase [Acidobacteria bacterium]|nr:3-isopropylmalate dehydratase [Acidobacteriota bacterium]
MDKPTILRGRTLAIRDAEGRPIDDIDTDMIFHNSHLHITRLEEMGPHAFGNLPGWKDFPQRVQPGDILVVGKNFGAGSSRQQAVDCFRALGVAAIVGESFGAIYKRNAINSGWPLFICPGILSDSGLVNVGDELEIDLNAAQIRNRTTGHELPPCDTFSRVQMDIYQAGSLFAFAKARS